MRYLVELTKQMSAKNKPQLEIINMLKKEAHRNIIEGKHVKPFANNILKRILEIEAMHPRCKSINVIFSENSHSREFKDQQLFCPDLFTIHFKGERV
jgi:hypothetical protein